MTRAPLLLSVLAALVVACNAGSAPTATPGGFTDVVSQLVLHGVTVHEHVSGDDGCPRVELHDNAARLNVSIAGDPSRHDVYLFRWRREQDFVASASDFFFCVGDFRSSHAGVIEVVEESPWRAFGAGWTDQLETAVRESIEAASP